MLSNEALAIQQLFHVQDKSGRKVQFVFNEAQQQFDLHDTPGGRTRLIISKARQKGFSTGALAKFAVRCLGVEGTHAVVISHETNATQRLLDRVDYFLKYMNGPKPTFGFNSRREISFPMRDSTYWIGTAGSRVFGRGDWITDLHCSEFAWWESPVDVFSGLFQAVPYEGRIYIESTGNGRNNDFYYVWENAEQMGYTRLFFPWFADNEYILPVQDWKPDFPGFNDYLLDVQAKYNITPQAMAWYEMKFKELRGVVKVMQQEYPSCPEDCFQATGGMIFESVTQAISQHWKSKYLHGYYVYMLEGHPDKDFHYVMGCDPSGGTGNDNSGLVMLCIETGEQVLEVANNTLNPIMFGSLIVKLGKEYNNAYIVCEANNHGAAVIPYLKDNYPRDKLYKRKFATRTTPAIYGWNNNETNKHALVGLMQENLDEITLYGWETVKELRKFQETAEGKMQGEKDDLVIATGLAIMGLRRFDYMRQEYLTPKVVMERVKPNYMTYTLDEVLANIAKRKQLINGWKNQAGVGYPNA